MSGNEALVRARPELSTLMPSMIRKAKLRLMKGKSQGISRVVQRLHARVPAAAQADANDSYASAQDSN